MAFITCSAYTYVQHVSTLAEDGLVRFTAPAQSGTQHGGGGYQILLSFKSIDTRGFNEAPSGLVTYVRLYYI